MNKTAIKNFAVWARNKLITDISYRAGLIGITEGGIASALPQSTGTTEFYDIGTAEPYSISGDAVRQRRRLVELIECKEKETDYKTAYKYIIEEVAYTWFNRLIAIRFMEVNDYLPSHIRVLSSESGKVEPDLVTTPFDADLFFSQVEESRIVQLKEENQLDELFRMLFMKQCNYLNDILPVLFEKTNDYTELLLNISVIDKDGIVYHLVHDIPEEDFNVEKGGQVEIIGWLYQYYNTEPKNEAFAKNGKITKEEVPAVTQLFTPDWIVRYMVENSLGRLWIDGHPNDELKRNWNYYLDDTDQEPKIQKRLDEICNEYAKLNPEDIKLIDPCMGSGHILVYAFDVLMQIYESVGYSQRDAAKSILEHNIYGLDIDERAYQLAYFSIMMKARQYNRRILDGNNSCHVYAVQESNDINHAHLKFYGEGLTSDERKIAELQIKMLLEVFRDAKEYGSILDVEECDWNLLRRYISKTNEDAQLSFESLGLEETTEKLNSLIDIGEIMARKYWITCTNPPYLNKKAMNTVVSNYCKKHYPDSKSDLFAVFIERALMLCKEYGLIAMITQHIFMFSTSFEELRTKLLCREIKNVIHLGARAFDEIGGEVVQTAAFAIRVNSNMQGVKGRYVRLTDFNGEYEKEKAFHDKNNYYIACQDAFKIIEGSPFAYWLSDAFFECFNMKRIANFADPRQGLSTSDNDRFLRFWYENNLEHIIFNCLSHEQSEVSEEKWYPYNKGGSFKKWYGNFEYTINWQYDGRELKEWAEWLNTHRTPMGRLVSKEYYFHQGMSWSALATGKISFRFTPNGFLFDSKGPMCFPFKQNDFNYILGFLNSVVANAYLEVLSPTLDFNQGPIRKIPFTGNFENRDEVEKIVQEEIELSKADWDSFETSWDFKTHPLVALRMNGAYAWGNDTPTMKLSSAYKSWEMICEGRFDKLKENEERLNRIFISIYGLQKELKPGVEDKDVTVRKADLQRDIKSLISYAVGCMLGRYSLDNEGLSYAGGNWIDSKYETFVPDVDNCIPITDEEYFEDDIVGLFCAWMKKVYGEKTFEENLDFIAEALGNKGTTSRDVIRNYFLNDFIKDHIKIYQKRPIYWMFDSGKQNGFKALVYMHRWNADSIGNLRVDYLHRMQRIYESEINRMQDMIDHSTNAREVATATKRKEKLQKQLKECREYDEKIGHLALSRIDIDLDDGVKVNYEKVQTASDGKKYQVLAKV